MPVIIQWQILYPRRLISGILNKQIKKNGSPNAEFPLFDGILKKSIENLFLRINPYPANVENMVSY